MRPLSDALQNSKLRDGISVRSDFTMPPGIYVILLVVRERKARR
jgi:hypothetical protein